MPYQTVEKRLRGGPEECMDEIAAYIDSVRFRYEKRNSGGASYFGSLKTLGDGMELQRKMRDEWA